MTIKTFDANRVGGGTFQLEQDATTGEYKIKEVGFVKLPELKLPEIDQAAYTVPDPTPDDPTGEDPTEPGTGTGTGGEGGGGGGNQQDFTGASTYKNIQDEATGDSADLMKQATTLSSNLSNVDRTSLDQGAIKVEDIRSLEAMPQAYQDLVNEYNRHQSDVQRRNREGNVSNEQGLSDLMYSRELRNQINEMKGTSFITAEGDLNKAGTTTIAGRADPEIIKAAPEIADFSEGPKTVPTGTLTGGLKGVPDAIVQGQPSLPDQNVFSKAKDVVSNSKPVQLIGAGARIAGTVLKGAATAILGPETNSQVHARKYFNIAGTSGQPQRIAGNPAENVFAGANANAKDLNRVAQKRIDTIEKNLAAGKYRDPDKKRQQLKDFKEQQANYKKDQRQEAIKRKGLDTKNPNEMRQADGGADSSPGGKSIVCTAMYQTTGLQDWAKAMKIWYIYQKRYLTIQHQEGYHKLFKPFVKAMHKSNIIKAIGAHFAKHRTQHLKHVMFNSKPSLLGKIYNKILEPICYWAGRK